jgi:hypothetical protein
VGLFSTSSTSKVTSINFQPVSNGSESAVGSTQQVLAESSKLSGGSLKLVQSELAGPFWNLSPQSSWTMVSTETYTPSIVANIQSPGASAESKPSVTTASVPKWLWIVLGIAAVLIVFVFRR